MPLVQVKSSDDITTAIVRFGISTMQTDIVLIANGTADSVLISNYDTNIISYVSSDQSIDQKDVAAGLISFNDTIVLDEDTSKVFNPLANDSLATSDTYSVSVSSPANGSAAVSASNQITYTPNGDYNGTDTFSYTVTQGSNSSTSDVTVTINPVNDLPVINVASTLNANENQTTVSNIGTSDVDTGDTLELSIGGTDASSFSLSSSNDLTFVSAPDYETKTSYSLTFSLTDGTETVTKTVTVNVINLNDVAPVISSTTAYSIDENLKAIGTIEVTDPDGGTFTFTTGGTDGASISISSSGVMSFVNAPDYETKTSYSFTVTVSDGVNSSSKTFTITINDLVEIPTRGYEVATSISIIDTKE